MLGYVITRKRNIYSNCNVKILQWIGMWTDHSVVRARFQLLISVKERRGPSGIPCRLNFHTIYDALLRKGIQVHVFNIKNIAAVQQTLSLDHCSNVRRLQQQHLRKMQKNSREYLVHFAHVAADAPGSKKLYHLTKDVYGSKNCATHLLLYLLIQMSLV